MTSSPGAVGEAVLLQRDGAVLVVTLNRPERRNAVNRQMWRALREAFIGARDDAGVHAVVVTGSGGSFCAGQDLGEMTGEDDPGFGALMDTLCEFDKPLLAAVNGVGVGFGLTFLLHCDVVYIAEGARLRPPFVTLGVVPEAASSYLLPAVRAVAARIARQPPEAVRHTKRLLMATRADHIRAARAREDEAFAERVGTAENLEAIAAFFEKRAPDFSRR